MRKRKRKSTKPAVITLTPERARKPDVSVGPGGRYHVKSYGQRLLARSVIDQRQLNAWIRIEHLAERADYQGRPRTINYGGIGGGVEISETEQYLRARKTLARLFARLGLVGKTTIEFMVIMGEDADTYANRLPGWNRHKILGALSLALDIAADELGVG